MIKLKQNAKDDSFTESGKMPVSSIGAAVGILVIAGGAVWTALSNQPAPALVAAAIGLYLMFAIKVADQWEKVAVLRLGRYIGLRGPGMFIIVPIVDSLSRFVDQRVRVASVSAESTLTRDTVPVNVDAIVFWMVWNAEKSILEVQDFAQAILLSAQTALRESIGRHELHQMVAEREMLGRELQRILDEKTNPGASPCNRWRSATCRSHRSCRTPCRARRRRNASGAPAPFWARPKPKSPTTSPRPRLLTRTTPWRCICAP